MLASVEKRPRLSIRGTSTVSLEWNRVVDIVADRAAPLHDKAALANMLDDSLGQNAREQIKKTVAGGEQNKSTDNEKTEHSKADAE